MAQEPFIDSLKIKDTALKKLKSLKNTSESSIITVKKN
jgi:hypothetical protein